MAPAEPSATLRFREAVRLTAVSALCSAGIMAQTLSDWGYLATDLSPDSTGLPFVVWVYPKSGSGRDVRIKISRSRKIRHQEQLLSVAIGPPVRVIKNGHGPSLTEHELRLLFRWVELNRAALIRHWHGESDSGDIIEAVKPIEGLIHDSI